MSPHAWGVPQFKGCVALAADIVSIKASTRTTGPAALQSPARRNQAADGSDDRCLDRPPIRAEGNVFADADAEPMLPWHPALTDLL